MMKYIISHDKLFKILEWILFFVFCIVAGWFASSAIEQFFLCKTSFSQQEEDIRTYPVITMVLEGYKASEINQTNVVIRYLTQGMNDFHNLEIGENHLANNGYNETENVILNSLENLDGKKVFRVIHTTPILEKKSPQVKLRIRIYNKSEKSHKGKEINIYVTSRENSAGFIDTWKDGKPLQLEMVENTGTKYNIQPQMTKYLEKLGKCQKESYYKCVASHLDVIEFNECTKKCIPNVFSNMGKNYSTAFCKNDIASQQCVFNHILKQGFGTHCKKSCSNLEYFGEVVRSDGARYPSKYFYRYVFIYTLTNLDFATKVYEEYLIYDFMGMIGSVGGTLGINTFIFLILYILLPLGI